MPKANNKTAYAKRYRKVDFRKHPLNYKIGRGEQGVLMAEPYKSQILPHWKFKTPAIAKMSSNHIFRMFRQYINDGDFVGADMARKFLQMGWTRARRYANHPGGRKYGIDGKIKAQAKDALVSEKAKSAQIFFVKYIKAKNDKRYLRLKDEFVRKQSERG